MDHDHRHDLPDTAVATQQPLRTTPVRIGEGSVLSTGTTVLAGARIGRYCIVAAGAVVRAGYYPDHSLIAGVPAAIKPGDSLRPAPPVVPVSLNIPQGLPFEHPDPAVQKRLTAYRHAHNTAAANPSPLTYRAAGEQAMLLQAALWSDASRDVPGDDHAELCHALIDHALEFVSQAERFPVPASR